MCVITTALVAGGLAAMGATTAAASTAAVAAATIGANVLIGAGLSTAVSAASGARGSDLGKAALIGGVTGGVLSGAGMAIGGVTTATTTSTTLSASQQLAMGATDVVPGMINQGAEAAALMANPSATTLPATTTIQGTTPGLVEAETAAWVTGTGKAALSLGAGGVQAYGNYQEGKENAKALKSEADMNEIRAGLAHEAAALEKMQQARRTRALTAGQRTAGAANGVMLETRAESSPAMFEQDARAELAWDGALADYNANMEAWSYMEQARLQRQQARTARRMGGLKAVGSLFSGAMGAGLALS